MHKLLFFIIPVMFITFSCTPGQKCGEEKRYIIDMGSSVTKHKISLINTCTKSQIKQIYSESKSYSLGDYLNLKYKKQQTFSLETEDMQIVSEEIKFIQNNFKKFKVKSAQIYATSVYRKILNIEKLEKSFKKVNVNFKVLTHVEELKYARLAVDNWLEKSPKFTNFNYITWSIGGQSTFLSYVNSSKLVEYQYYADWGSYNNLSFAKENGFSIEALITEDDEAKNKSINKLIKAMKNKVAKDKKLSFLKSLIKDNEVMFVGIGGVHKYSALKNMNIEKNKNVYTDIDLKELITTNLIWDKVELSSQFGPHLIPNLAYLHAIFEQLGIKKVLVLDTNFKDYLLVN